MENFIKKLQELVINNSSNKTFVFYKNYKNELIFDHLNHVVILEIVPNTNNTFLQVFEKSTLKNDSAFLSHRPNSLYSRNSSDYNLETLIQYLVALMYLNQFVKLLNFDLGSRYISFRLVNLTNYFIDIMLTEEITINIIHGEYIECFNCDVIKVSNDSLNVNEVADLLLKKWEKRCISNVLSNNTFKFKLEDCIVRAPSNMHTVNNVLTIFPWNNYIKPSDITNIEDIFEIRIYSKSLVIEKNTFKSAPNLRKILYKPPQGIELVIKPSTFKNCKNLEELIISNPSTEITLVRIEAQAFEGCESLKQISISNVNLRLDTKVFKGCTDIVDFNLDLKLLQISIDLDFLILSDQYKLPFKNLYRKILKMLRRYESNNFDVRFQNSLPYLISKHGMFYLPGELPLLYDIRFLKLYLNIRNIDLSEDERNKPIIYLVRSSVDDWNDYVKYLTIYTLSFELRGRYSWIFNLIMKLIILWVIVVI